MPPTFSRICLFLSHSADENAAQDEQRFSFGGFAQGHIGEFDSDSIRCEGLVLGVARRACNHDRSFPLLLDLLE